MAIKELNDYAVYPGGDAAVQWQGIAGDATNGLVGKFGNDDDWLNLLNNIMISGFSVNLLPIIKEQLSSGKGDLIVPINSAINGYALPHDQNGFVLVVKDTTHVSLPAPITPDQGEFAQTILRNHIVKMLSQNPDGPWFQPLSGRAIK